MTPAIGFYGDDFTGSSDNLAQYGRNGLSGMLFFDPADREAVQRHVRDLDVVGFAGIGRSLPEEALGEELRGAFDALASLRPRLVQYKVCSTFDSSRAAGNFAVALREARRQWPGCAVPVLAAVPDFGRYTVFGNHFAVHRGEVFRLDRHPSMSRHPVTPMKEASLRAHLADLGEPGAHLVDVLALGAGREAARRAVSEAFAKGDQAVVLDTLTEDHLRLAAELVWELSASRPVFALAAQGLSHGLGQHLSRGRGDGSGGREAVEQVLVLSGSCAPQTAIQIAHAEAAGYQVLSVDVPRLVQGDAAQVEQDLLGRAAAALHRGASVVICTARGPDDPAVATARTAVERAGLGSEGLARSIGQLYARIFKALASAAGLRRTVFAGGDTSSYAMRASGAYALSITSTDFHESAHLCRLHAEDPVLDGAQVLLKGGQAGSDAFMVEARRERSARLQ